MSSAASTILKAFTPYLTDMTLKEIFDVGVANKLPCFSQKIILQLCTEMYLTIKSVGPLIRLKSPMFVIGDIHGNFHDLIRIINDIPVPFYEGQFVFLGDYVDRGSYSIDVICLLFALKVKYPDTIQLLRGNHEFEDTNGTYGFKDEVIERYEEEQIYYRVNEIFAYLPIAAVIDDDIFCVHGGISPLLTSIHDIEIVSLPLMDCTQEMISDLMWSDPEEKVNGFLQSKRGRGKTFGVTALRNFFGQTGFKRIIRGHQCMQYGIGSFHKGAVTTVFSSSYYNSEENCAAYLEIKEGSHFQTHKLKPNRYIVRQHAKYYFVNDDKIKRSGSITLQLQPTDLLYSGAVNPQQQQQQQLLLNSAGMFSPKSSDGAYLHSSLGDLPEVNSATTPPFLYQTGSLPKSSGNSIKRSQSNISPEYIVAKKMGTISDDMFTIYSSRVDSNNNNNNSPNTTNTNNNNNNNDNLIMKNNNTNIGLRSSISDGNYNNFTNSVQFDQQMNDNDINNNGSILDEELGTIKIKDSSISSAHCSCDKIGLPPLWRGTTNGTGGGIVGSVSASSAAGKLVVGGRCLPLVRKRNSSMTRLGPIYNRRKRMMSVPMGQAPAAIAMALRYSDCEQQDDIDDIEEQIRNPDLGMEMEGLTEVAEQQ